MEYITSFMSSSSQLKTNRPINKNRNKGKVDHKLYYDENLKKYVRVSAFGTKEYLDPETYQEALNTEKIYNDMLDSYLKNIKEHDNKQ